MYQSLILTLFILLTTTTAVTAQERLALVIGNDAYQALPPVPRAQQDAQDVADGLAELGFDVDLVINANLRFQRFSIQQYLDALKNAAPGSVGIVYYHGHGVAVDDANFLVPPNFQGEDAYDIVRTSIALNRLLVAPDTNAGTTSVVILDCCAANPFGDGDDMVAQGLVEMRAPDGVILAYAAAPQTAAVDDRTFAQGLIAGMSAPGVSLQDVLGGLGPNFVSDGAADPIVLVPPVEQSEEEIAWNAIRDTTDPDAVLAFLETYPDGPYSDRAQALIVDLLAAELTDDSDAPVADQTAAAPEPDQAAQPTETPQTSVPADPELAAIVAQIAATEVSFTTPLAAGSPDITGQTIEALIAGYATFPPIEGLAEEMWIDQTCASCHAWNAENLCEQADFYLDDAGAENLAKPHPYGGTFKRNLAQWALGGCQ